MPINAPVSSGLSTIAESFDAAIAAAEAEAPTGADAAEDTPTGVADVAEAEAPAVQVEQDEATVGEQPLVDDAPTEEPVANIDDESVFGDVADELTGSDADASDEPDPAAFWDTQVQVQEGGPAVPLHELRDGYLRQADYTRKTQELARQREEWSKENEGLTKLAELLKTNPAETVAKMAVQLGMLTEEQAGVASAQVEGFDPPSQEKGDQMVEERVKAELAEHPVLRQAAAVSAQAAIDQAFTEIEDHHGVRLTPKDRDLVLDRAIAANTTDLNMVYLSLRANADEVRTRRQAAAPARPGGRQDVEAPAAELRRKVTSLEGDVGDAFALALAEMEASG